MNPRKDSVSGADGAAQADDAPLVAFQDVGRAILDRIWARNDMDEDAAHRLVREAITETRRAAR
jgi:hypothetical protein